MTLPVSNNISSNIILNGRQVYTPAVNEVSSFLASPLESDLALSAQFNPSGSNGDFFRMMSSLMNNFKVQTSQSASMIQTAGTAVPAQPAGVPLPGLGVGPAAPAAGAAPSGDIMAQLGAIINSLQTLLPALGK